MRDDLKALLQSPPALVGHAGGRGVLLGTLGCLELNLRGMPFPGWSSAESRRAVAQAFLTVLRKMRRRKWALVAEMRELSHDERLVLLERGQLTGAMAARQDGVHVLLNDRQDTECYINDEEHFLFKTFYPGAQGLKQALQDMSRLLADFNKKLPLAHDPVFGYLSCDPAKGGEALFFSSMLHLPALRLARHLESSQRALDEMGVFLSPLPIYDPEHKKDEGDLYLLHSPAAMAGKLSDALRTMEMATEAICQHEQYAREKLMEEPRSAERVCNAILHACHQLTQADKLKYRELLGGLSMLRLGLYYGTLQTEVSGDELDELISLTYFHNAPAQMTHVQGIATQRERRQARARYTRELLLSKLRLQMNKPTQIS